MSPEEINRKNGFHYKCRVCHTDKNLSWFRGTSCPVCEKPECIKELCREWEEAYNGDQEDYEL